MTPSCDGTNRKHTDGSHAKEEGVIFHVLENTKRVLGAATVILAMGEDRRAAESINELLRDS